MGICRNHFGLWSHPVSGVVEIQFAADVKEKKEKEKRKKTCPIACLRARQCASLFRLVSAMNEFPLAERNTIRSTGFLGRRRVRINGPLFTFALFVIIAWRIGREMHTDITLACSFRLAKQLPARSIFNSPARTSCGSSLYSLIDDSQRQRRVCHQSKRIYPNLAEAGFFGFCRTGSFDRS
jgi:hypothetical protein